MKDLKRKVLLYVVLSGTLALAPLTAQVNIQTWTGNRHCQFQLAGNDLILNCENDGVPDGDAIPLQHLRLENGNLLFDFSLPKPAKDQFYALQLQARSNHKSFSAPFSGLLETETIGLEDWQSVNQLHWPYFVHQIIPNELDPIDITLTVKLYGHPPIDCDGPEPTFDQREKVTYYLVGGVGVALAGTGLLLRGQSDDKYDEYKTLHIAGNEGAEGTYHQANEKYHNSTLLMGAGIAILVVDAALYTFRSIRHKKKMQWYQEYCPGKTLTVNPWYELNTDSEYTGAIGLKLSWRF